MRERAKQTNSQNSELREAIDKIEVRNAELVEVRNHISVLVSKMMTISNMRLSIIEKLRKTISINIKARNYDNIQTLTDAAAKEMTSSKVEIDDILLAIYPKFFEQFNSLLREECHFKIDNKNGLPVEMRIFVPWRLGIRKNEDIASCLGYSLYTVKSYKNENH